MFFHPSRHKSRAIAASSPHALRTADPPFVLVKGASCPDPTTVYVDMRALRNDRVALVEKGSPHSLCLMESGKVRALF